MKRTIQTFIATSLILIIAVPVTNGVFDFFTVPSHEGEISTGYSSQQIIAGICSEVLRALITVWIYSSTISKGSSMQHGIKYGLLYSALIASLYIILGAFYFEVKDPFGFIMVDTVILIVQGIGSGMVLYCGFRQSGKSTNAPENTLR